MEIKKYFNYELKFNGVYSRDDLHKIKDGMYVINLNNKQKQHIKFHYLLTQIKLCTFWN